MSKKLVVRDNILILLVFCTWAVISCSKKEFLEEIPSSDIFIPSTLNDFQAVLDADLIMGETPMMGELSADNYYISNTFYNSLRTRERTCYTWEADIYQYNDYTIEDWNIPYQQVFYANVVLDGLDKVQTNSDNQAQWNSIYGSALFIRAYAFYNLAQIFSPAYDRNISAEENMFGIPLRESSNIDHVPRSTLTETYDFITSSLKESASRLPVEIDTTHLNRPSKAAAYALLARVYLSMREYDNALIYADSCLSLHNSLINFNSINLITSFPFQRMNAETIYQSRLLGATNVLKAVVAPFCFVDSNLYKSYSPNDRRKSIFFSETMNLKGSYTGSLFMFTGLATDEVLCIKAECLARAGNVIEAMNTLNQLLESRWDNGTFSPLDAANEQEALNIILEERRKELPFRGVRWSDLRRLNKEGWNITLRRDIDGNLIELPPNSRKYVLPLPDDIVEFTRFSQYSRN